MPGADAGEVIHEGLRQAWPVKDDSAPVEFLVRQPELCLADRPVAEVLPTVVLAYGSVNHDGPWIILLIGQ